MNRFGKLLALVVAGALILGCEGPKIKQAVESLTPQITELENGIANVQGTLVKVVELVNIVANDKVEKGKIDTLAMFADQLKGELNAILPLGEQAQLLSDTLAVLDKKASGDNKKAIEGLMEKLNAVSTTLGEARNGCGTLDQIKVKLEEMKKPAVATKKGKPVKKVVK